MTQFELEAGRKLIVALDMPDAGEAYEFWQRLALPEAVAKIGLELLFSGGVELAQKLAAQGVRVFVDAKLFDIGNTVEQATARVAALGAAFLTVHAQDAQTVAAAVRGRGRSDLKLLGITLLTSTAPESLGAQGISLSPAEPGAPARPNCRGGRFRWRGLFALGGTRSEGELRREICRGLS